MRKRLKRAVRVAIIISGFGAITTFLALVRAVTILGLAISIPYEVRNVGVSLSVAFSIGFTLIPELHRRKTTEFEKVRSSDDETKRSQNFVDFIDILFAIVMAEGFIYISATSTGVVQWFESFDFLPIINTISAF